MQTKPPTSRRSSTVSVLLTLAERRRISVAAARAGLSLSSYIRTTIIQALEQTHENHPVT